MNSDDDVKVGLVCEAGGPFKQLRLIETGLNEFDCFYITYQTEATENIVGYLLPKTYQQIAAGFFEYRLNSSKIKGIIYIPIIFLYIFYIFAIERPNVIITTGDLTIAGPSFCIAKLFGIRTIFIESIGQFEGPSTAGQVLGPIADRVLVQNPETLKGHVDKAEYKGGIF